MVDSDFAELAGRRIGLITNATARSADGRHAIDILAQSDRLRLEALFSPEHGIRGDREAGADVPTLSDSLTGLPINSLYGDTRRPTAKMVEGLDALVFDIQDVGTRFYTYISTLYLCLQAASEFDLAFFVLDRPNPIGGTLVEGPVLSSEFASFVGIAPIPLRHGLTVGELALLFNQSGWVHRGRPIDLTVIACDGWRRDQTFCRTELTWIPPSPNMVSPQTALVYPATGLLEGSNVSEGRGTANPFRIIGAPWIDAPQLAARLSATVTADVQIDTLSFVPQALTGKSMNPKYLHQRCQGLFLTVNNPRDFLSVEFGIHLLVALRDLYPDDLLLREEWLNKLLGTDQITKALKEGKDAVAIMQICNSEITDFEKLRRTVLIYPDIDSMQ
ncbi:DUF1343 domain-containing protein [candidate division KSB1 bacterium]|nr:DUF1343 domain-containing protein [candidate division KSB1 bacterium]